MSNQVMLEQAERRALSLSIVDGIWDLLLGLFFFIQAFIDPIESLGTSRLAAYVPLILFLPIGFWVFRWLKQRYTIPRIGLVKTAARSNQQEKRLLTLVWVIVAFTGMVFTANSFGYFEKFGWTGSWLTAWGVDLLFGLLTFAVFSQLAYSLIAPRFYFYGLLLGTAMLLTPLLSDQGEWIASLPMMVTGVVIALGGALIFTRFLRQYPQAAGERADG